MLIKSSINHHAVCGSLVSVVDMAFGLKTEWPGVPISVTEKLFFSPKTSEQLWGPNCMQFNYQRGSSAGLWPPEFDVGHSSKSSSSLAQQPLFEPRPSSEASASCPYSLQHSSNFSPPASWHLPSHHLPISVSACSSVFFLLPLQQELFL